MKKKITDKHKNRDKYYSEVSNLHVEDFKQYTLACRKLEDLPW